MILESLTQLSIHGSSQDQSVTLRVSAFHLNLPRPHDTSEVRKPRLRKANDQTHHAPQRDPRCPQKAPQRHPPNLCWAFQRATPLPPASIPGPPTESSSATPLPWPRPALLRFCASGARVLPVCAGGSGRGKVWRGVEMAAGGSDPRAGDVEEDASQLIFPKGGAGTAGLPLLSCVIAAGLALPMYRPRRAAGRVACAERGREDGGCGGERGPGWGRGRAPPGCFERGLLDSTPATLETSAPSSTLPLSSLFLLV